ncbi:MAG: hypothetical protein ABIS23_02245 [Sphingomicrobium sp.]
MRFKTVVLGAALLGSAAPASAAWHESRSRHFNVYADASPEWLRAFSTKLEKFDQAVRTIRNMDDPALGESGRVTIYMLPDSNSVSKLAVGKRSSIAGFYIPRAGGSVAFVPRKAGSQDWDMSVEDTLFHEYAHHIMFQAVEDALPPWLVEGFAEFYTTAEFEKDGSVRLALPAYHRIYGLYQLPRPKMETLLGTDSELSRTDEETEAFYGWSWVLTHYLTFADERKGQLGRYIGALRNGAEPVNAARQAFGDFDQLGRDAERYLKRNKFKNLAVAKAAPDSASIVVRSLRRGEAAIMTQVIQSKRGVNRETALGVAAAIRTAAATYADDPAVLRALAEAEFDAGNHEAAEKAATRTTQIDPGNGKAWIYRGRAQSELENGGATDAQWERIRSNFLRANAADKEDAEPLWLYYESFGSAGQKATRNAIDGLDYALVLAPQDPNLRVATVVQRINDKRLSEAREAIAPLAYSPHPGPSRNRARKALAALDAKDANGALEALTTRVSNEPATSD